MSNFYTGNQGQSHVTLTFDPHDFQNLISPSLSGTECLCIIFNRNPLTGTGDTA